MFRNYLKIAWRNLLKNKVYSFINIGGLAVGMAVAMLIWLWVWDEWSFNKSFQNNERIGQVYQNRNFDGKIRTFNTVPHPMASELRKSFPDFEATSMADKHEHIIAAGDKKFTVSGLFVEPSFTKIFSFNMKTGLADGLNEINNILLSNTISQNLFGTENAMGKTITLDNKISLKVAGVYNDFPKSSDFADIKMLAPWSTYISIDNMAKNTQNHWGSNDWLCYVLLQNEDKFNEAETKIKSLLYDKVDKDEKTTKPELLLHPLKKWHLYETFTEGKNTGGLIQIVKLFGIIGLFVVLLACINFMNLSTARSENRAKEIGIRKVVGSLKAQLVYQFLSESMVVVILAYFFTGLIVAFSLPAFNILTNKQISIPWSNGIFGAINFALIIGIGLLAGSYPAMYLSSFKPISVLKGNRSSLRLKIGKWATVPRKALVVLQFSISIALIIGTLAIFQQIQFVKNRPIGYNNNRLIYLSMSTPALKNLNYGLLKTELINTNVVENVSQSSNPVTTRGNLNIGYKWDGDESKSSVVFNEMRATLNNGATLGFQFVEGRDFSEQFATDSTGVIVNEFAAKLISNKSVIGKTIKNSNIGEFHIVGVIKNIVDESPYAEAIPSLYFLSDDNLNSINIKLKPTVSTTKALSKIESVFRKLDSAAPFDYKFADQDLAKKYMSEELIGKLAFLFAVLAIFISCLGLFGLASFVADQRSKEIGIRKVLGATVAKLWQLLSKDFVALVLISCLIAAPIAYYFMHEWLQKYTYRTEISWWIFVIASIGALGITLLTVSYQAIKAALINPIKSLKTE